MSTLELTEQEKERFWSKVQKSEGCWICSANPSGIYARIQINGRMWCAHVISYILANGGLEEGKKVCHICDTPRCVRPDHLEAKTHAENMRDMVSRNRHRPRFGLDNNLGKLSDGEVREIKAHLQLKTRTIKELAAIYRVSFQAIYRIGRGQARGLIGGGTPVINLRPVRHLTEQDVLEIRRRVASGERQRRIADDFGIWQATVSQIARGVKRRDVSMDAHLPLATP